MNDRTKDIVTNLARRWLALNHGSLGIPAKGKQRTAALIEFLRGATMLATATGDEELAQALCAPMFMVCARSDTREIEGFAKRALSTEAETHPLLIATNLQGNHAAAFQAPGEGGCFDEDQPYRGPDERY